MSEGYTRPERAAEIAVARRILVRVNRCQGCPMCLHRVEVWGMAACGLEPAKRFPECVRDARTGFTLDTARVSHEVR